MNVIELERLMAAIKAYLMDKDLFGAKGERLFNLGDVYVSDNSIEWRPKNWRMGNDYIQAYINEDTLKPTIVIM